MTTTALARREDTPQRAHAAFCQRQFTLDLFWRIRLWKWLGTPVER